jgi:hypothetical protein
MYVATVGMLEKNTNLGFEFKAVNLGPTFDFGQ